jgi:hypothetical protein
VAQSLRVSWMMFLFWVWVKGVSAIVVAAGSVGGRPGSQQEDLDPSVFDAAAAVDDDIEERKRDRQQAQQQDADEYDCLRMLTRPIEKRTQDSNGEQQPDQRRRGCR